MMLKHKQFINLVALGLFLLAAGPVACQSTNKQPDPSGKQGTVARATIEAPSPRIDRLMLMVDSGSAINWDQKPGPDGVRVKLYLFQINGSKVNATELQRGTIELLLFDGRFSIHQLPDIKPLQKWQYSAHQMKDASNVTAAGPAYGLALPFGKKLPKSDVITVSARVLQPNGSAMYARPIHLTMKPR
jgi:hypothetical protein